jgi:hypothetical protein
MSSDMKRGLFFFGILLICMGTLFALDAEYTNQKQINLSGQMAPLTSAELFVNQKSVGSVASDAAGNWTATAVPVSDGENVIQINEPKFLGFSSLVEVARVVVDTLPPELYVGVTPRSAKQEDQLTLMVDANEKLKSATALWPDRTQMDLSYNRWNGKWEGTWKVHSGVSSGVYKAIITGMDLAGNVNRKESNEFSLWTAPAFTVTSPPENLVTYTDRILVEGIVKEAPLVMVNGQEVMADKDGNYTFPLPLNPGRKTITVQSVNLKDGRVVVENREVLRLLTFPDIANHWARPQIEQLATLGFIDRLQNSDLFAPEKEINRSLLAVLLVKIKKIPLSKAGDQRMFTDVPADYWAVNYIQTAAQMDLVQGYPGDRFIPEGFVSRAEAVSTLIRLMGLSGGTAARAVATDVPVTHWAASYFELGLAHQLLPLSWTHAGRLFPSRPVTRAEMIYMISQLPSVKIAIETLYPKAETKQSQVIEASSFSDIPEVTVRKVVTLPAGQAAKMNAGNVQEVRPEVFSPLLNLESSTANSLRDVLPEMTLLSPPDQFLTYSSWLKIQGSCQNTDALYLNGQQLSLRNGRFSERLNILKPGKNLLNFAVVANSGEKLEVTRKVLLLPSYTDIPETHWGVKTIGALTLLGYLVPETPDQFLPRKEISRGETALLIARIKGLDMVKPQKDPASDVFRENPLAPAIQAVIKQGYMSVGAKGQFRPYQAVSRADFAEAVCKMEGFSRTRVLRDFPFRDVPPASPLAGVLTAFLENGIIVAAPAFSPQSPVLRSVGVSILSKTSDLQRELRDLFSWEIGFDATAAPMLVATPLPRVESTKSASKKSVSEEVPIVFEVTPLLVAAGEPLQISVKTFQPVINVLITFPNGDSLPLTGKDREWTLTWRVPDLDPQRYQLEALIIRANGDVQQQLSPEFTVKNKSVSLPVFPTAVVPTTTNVRIPTFESPSSPTLEIPLLPTQRSLPALTSTSSATVDALVTKSREALVTEPVEVERPVFRLYQPTDGKVTFEPAEIIEGQLFRGDELRMNGTRISLNPNKQFYKKIQVQTLGKNEWRFDIFEQGNLIASESRHVVRFPAFSESKQLAALDRERWGTLIMDGFFTLDNAGRVGPKQLVTRAEMAQWMTQLQSIKPEAPTTDVAPDVKADDPQSPVIAEAIRRGWMGPYFDHTFRSKGTLSRALAVVLLDRLMDSEPPSASPLAMADVSAHHWAGSAIARMVARGVIQDTGPYFYPDQDADRDFISKMIYTIKNTNFKF